MNEQSMSINIGIDDEDRRAIAEGLSRLLADTCTLYVEDAQLPLERRRAHVQHPAFDVRAAVQRIGSGGGCHRRAHPCAGVAAPGSYAQFAKLTSIRERTGTLDAAEMLRQLMADQETVARTAREVFPRVDEANDEPSADPPTQRMQVHEKTAGMLRSMLQRQVRR